MDRQSEPLIHGLRVASKTGDIRRSFPSWAIPSGPAEERSFIARKGKIKVGAGTGSARRMGAKSRPGR